MILKRLCVFEPQVKNVSEIRKNTNKLFTIRSVCVQYGAVRCVGLGDKPLAIFLQELFIARCLDIPLLNLRELLLQMGIERLLGFRAILRGLCDLFSP